ncbi:hypothetical protein CTEN210_13513 [Chaetoceros tenuissimus]|uniref:Uncharacterized protein n=1 Tax=Chaetoceros tenuissimus TaxID=426638 RepID=A0AAD3D3V6_9STRA|nr:hypothetical protein CTEN210_13513 [Chaetoceros tenuissimus]
MHETTSSFFWSTSWKSKRKRTVASVLVILSALFLAYTIVEVAHHNSISTLINPTKINEADDAKRAETRLNISRVLQGNKPDNPSGGTQAMLQDIMDYVQSNSGTLSDLKEMIDNVQSNMGTLANQNLLKDSVGVDLKGMIDNVQSNMGTLANQNLLKDSVGVDLKGMIDNVQSNMGTLANQNLLKDSIGDIESDATTTQEMLSDSIEECQEGKNTQHLQLSSWWTHSCAIFMSEIQCTGTTHRGEFGIDPSSTPYTYGIPVSLVLPFSLFPVKVGTGFFHTCVLTNLKTVLCFGANDYGQLGDGTTFDSFSPVEVMKDGSPLQDVIDLEVAAYHACAIQKSGLFYCWGRNDYNLLGWNGQANVAMMTLSTISTCVVFRDDPTTISCKGSQDRVLNMDKKFIKLTGGNFHHCALFADSSAGCFGHSGYGQFGNGSSQGTAKFEFVLKEKNSSELLYGITDIDAGEYTTCVIVDKKPMCFGMNNRFQLGIANGGNNVLYPTPPTVTLPTGKEATSAHVGWYTGHVVYSDNSVYSFGTNMNGLLGDGAYNHDPNRVVGDEENEDAAKMLFFVTPLQFSINYSHACALFLSKVQCVGSLNGELLNGIAPDQSSSPVTLALPYSLSPVKVITGNKYTCILTSLKTVVCFGVKLVGKYTKSTVPTPFQVMKAGSALEDVIDIEAGSDHACAIQTSGQLYCWGRNYYNQLGHSGQEGVAMMNLLNMATCVVIKSDLTQVRCKGHDFNDKVYDMGQEIVKLTARHEHLCVLLADQTAKCVGNNEYGQLGSGSHDDSYDTPVSVKDVITDPPYFDEPPPLTGITDINVGYDSTCLVANGTPMCFGRNANFQLGISKFNGEEGADVIYPTPLTVGLPTDKEVVSVHVGEYTGHAVYSDHSVYAWGSNTWGTLGDGSEDVGEIIGDEIGEDAVKMAFTLL